MWAIFEYFRMGAGVYDYKELSHQMELYTGGLSASCHIASHPSQLNSLEEVCNPVQA